MFGDWTVFDFTLENDTHHKMLAVFEFNTSTKYTMKIIDFMFATKVFPN